MTAYIIGNVHTLDTSDALAEYRRRVGATLEEYGGRFAIRGGKIDVLEGSWIPVHLSIMEFDDGEQARKWLSSAIYQEILPLRAGVEMDLVIVEPKSEKG
jgi:uncharacterized protein (DUF1330 family)